jgi:ATP-binding cassette subfamily B protein
MKSLQYLNKYFFKYKWRFLFGILFTIISNYFGVQMPLYVKSTVDDIAIAGIYKGIIHHYLKKSPIPNHPISNVFFLENKKIKHVQY